MSVHKATYSAELVKKVEQLYFPHFGTKNVDEYLRFTFIDPEKENVLTCIPFIGLYPATKSNTLYLARIVFNSGNFRTFLRGCYGAGMEDFFLFPAVLFSNPVASAEVFNRRLGLRQDSAGLWRAIYPNVQALPYHAAAATARPVI